MNNHGAVTTSSTKLLLLLVGTNIAMQLVNASLIKLAVNIGSSRLILLGCVLAIVMLLSLGRFIVWRALHKRYPVSVAYPATALFFPCVVLLAYFYGEPVSLPQGLGAGLVTAGIILLLRPKKARNESIL